MSPEAAGNLVVLAIESKNSKFTCIAHRLDPVVWDDDTAFVHASFAANEPPPGFDAFAGGVIFANRMGYKSSSYSAALGKAGRRFSWRHPVHRHGLMFVVVLPKGYTLPSVDETYPCPVESKVLDDGRLVLHWEIPGATGNSKAEIVWQMEPTSATRDELASFSERLNEECFNRQRSAYSAAPIPHFPAWAPTAGAIFGGLTLLFFMAIVWSMMSGHQLPTNAKFPIVSVLALGLAMASAFIGGDAAAKGKLPVPMLKEKPVEFSVVGGIAVFVIVFLIGNAAFGTETPIPAPTPTPIAALTPTPTLTLDGSSHTKPKERISVSLVIKSGTANSGALALNPDAVSEVPQELLDQGFVVVGGGCRFTYHDHGGEHAPVPVISIPLSNGWECKAADFVAQPIYAQATATVIYARAESSRPSVHLACKTVPATSPQGNNVSADASIATLSGFALVGGGCETTFRGKGSLYAKPIVESYPTTDGNSWHCQTADPANQGTTGTVKAYARACQIQDSDPDPRFSLPQLETSVAPGTVDGPRQYPDASIKGSNITGGGCVVSYIGGSSHAEHMVVNTLEGSGWSCAGADPPGIGNSSIAQAFVVSATVK